MGSMTKRQRRHARVQQVIETLRQIYGSSYVPRGPGSIHEGEELDDAELVLHELAHQTLLPPDYVFSPRNMKSAGSIVDTYLKTKPEWLRDIHELYAVAIELLVGRHYRLKLNEYGIIDEAYTNTHYHLQIITLRKQSWEGMVRRAMKTEKAIKRAETIIALISEFEKGNL